MSKNAKKPALVESPTVKMSELDCVEVGMNKSGNAAVVTLKMFAGAVKTQSAKIAEKKKDKDGNWVKGDEKTVEWKTMGRIYLDDTFEMPDGTLCRLVVGKEFGKRAFLEVRPAGSGSEETTADLSF